MEEKQKKIPAKRIQLVDVVLERRGSQLFSGRRIRSLEDCSTHHSRFHRRQRQREDCDVGLKTNNFKNEHS